MTKPDYEFDASQLTRYMFFEATEGGPWGGRIRVMCNYCTKEKFLFFDGEATDLTGGEWLAQAAVHAVTEHGRK